MLLIIFDLILVMRTRIFIFVVSLMLMLVVGFLMFGEFNLKMMLNDLVLISLCSKGSMFFKGFMLCCEFIVCCVVMWFGGFCVVIVGGNSVGIDVLLYFVSVLVDDECVNEVVWVMQWNWIKGIVVDGLDV